MYLSTTESKKQNKRTSRTGTDSDTENILTVARWEERGWEDGEKGEEIKKYKLVVTEQSWECKVQQIGYSQ